MTTTEPDLVEETETDDEWTPPPEPEAAAVAPDPRPAHAYAPWIRPLSAYERRETTIVEGLR